MSATIDCRCAIALRVASTLACEAVEWLAEVSPERARLALDHAEEHARRLRAACDSGNHGPQAKP